MPILEEEGPDDMLFHQYGDPPHFCKEVIQVSREVDWQGWAYRLAISFP
jgi:hypothetical protein